MNSSMCPRLMFPWSVVWILVVWEVNHVLSKGQRWKYHVSELARIHRTRSGVEILIRPLVSSFTVLTWPENTTGCCSHSRNISPPSVNIWWMWCHVFSCLTGSTIWTEAGLICSSHASSGCIRTGPDIWVFYLCVCETLQPEWQECVWDWKNSLHLQDCLLTSCDPLSRDDTQYLLRFICISRFTRNPDSVAICILNLC